MRPFHLGDIQERSLTRLVVFLWLAFVAAISLMPLKLKSSVGTTGTLHNPGHFLIFVATALLLCRTARNWNTRLLRWACVCIFAGAMEFLEWVTYHNPFEWRDVLVDSLGATLGLLVVSLWCVRLKRTVGQQNV